MERPGETSAEPQACVARAATLPCSPSSTLTLVTTLDHAHAPHAHTYIDAYILPAVPLPFHCRSTAATWLLHRGSTTLQLLHCWAESHRVALLLRLAHTMLPRSIRANTAVLVTKVERDKWGLDRAIFQNRKLNDLSRPLLERDTERREAADLTKWRRDRQNAWRELTPMALTRGGHPRVGRQRSRSHDR